MQTIALTTIASTPRVSMEASGHSSRRTGGDEMGLVGRRDTRLNLWAFVWLALLACPAFAGDGADKPAAADASAATDTAGQGTPASPMPAGMASATGDVSPVQEAESRPAAAPTRISEVVVTATKRRQNLRDI